MGPARTTTALLPASPEAWGFHAAANKPTAWDDYAGAPSVLSVEVMEPTEPWVIRAHFRTHPFDIATAALAAARPEAPALAAAAGEEYRLRAAAIDCEAADLPAADAAPERENRILRKSRGEMQFLWAGAVVIGVTILQLAVAEDVDARRIIWVMLLLVVTAAIVAAAVWLLPKSVLTRRLVPEKRLSARLHRLRQGVCCDCEYHLAGLPPGLPIELAGVNVGPARCPECNAAWPLVPGQTVLTGRYPITQHDGMPPVSTPTPAHEDAPRTITPAPAPIPGAGDHTLPSEFWTPDRIAPFALAAAEWQQRGPQFRSCIAAAGEEYLRRLAILRRESQRPEAWLPRHPQAEPPRDHPAVRAWLIGVLVLWAVALAVGVTMRWLTMDCWLMAATVLLFGVVLGRLYPEQRSDVELDESWPVRLARCVQRRRCCHCDHSLKGIPPALPAHVAGANVGPATCPRCRTPWPLVPPTLVPPPDRSQPGPSPATAMRNAGTDH